MEVVAVVEAVMVLVVVEEVEVPEAVGAREDCERVDESFVVEIEVERVVVESEVEIDNVCRRTFATFAPVPDDVEAEVVDPTDEEPANELERVVEVVEAPLVVEAAPAVEVTTLKVDVTGTTQTARFLCSQGFAGNACSRNGQLAIHSRNSKEERTRQYKSRSSSFLHACSCRDSDDAARRVTAILAFADEVVAGAVVVPETTFVDEDERSEGEEVERAEERREVVTGSGL